MQGPVQSGAMAVPLTPMLQAVPEQAWLGPAAAGASSAGSILDLSRLWISGHPPGALPAVVQPPMSYPALGPGLLGMPGNPRGMVTTGFPSMQQGLQQPYMMGQHSALGKRMSVETNHNKAITKCLASAVHYQQVLDCVADCVTLFDEVNVATALHRLAKLQPQAPGGQPSPVVYANQFQQLVTAARVLLPRFEAQAVSNTMWAFATLNHIPDGRLLEDLANHAATIIHTFRPQATSNTLWAFAKLGVSPPEALLVAAAQQMLQDLHKSVPQDISNTLWAFASLRHYPGDELMVRSAHQAVLAAQRFKPQEVANTLWSYATLGHDPGQSLRDAMAVQMVARIQQFRPQAVSNSLWAFAQLGHAPAGPLLEVACQRAGGMLHQYTSQEVANTLWALATLEHHPGTAFLDAAAVQIARRMEQFTPQDVANCIWAFAKLFHYPCKELLHGTALHLLRHWQRFRAAEVASALEALAILEGCTLQAWQLLLAKLGSVPASSFDDDALRKLFRAHLLVDAAMAHSGLEAVQPSFPQQLLTAAERAWSAAVQKTGNISALHEQVSRALWSLGVPHHSEHVCAGGLFCVDIALDDTNVVIEIQGPSAYAANTTAPLGQTVARRIALEATGLTVLSVAFFEWELLESMQQRERYLSCLLASAVPHHSLA